MTLTSVIAILALPVLATIATGGILLKRALARQKRLPEEFAFAAAYVFLVGSLVWLGVFLSGSTLLGFGSPWSWLAALHFAFAGFGSLTVTALCCRAVFHESSLKTLRFLLIAHPVAYLITAGGIMGYPLCDEIGASAYELIFLTQLVAFLTGKPNRIPCGPRLLVTIALAVPVVTLIPALFWAWGQPIFDISGMIRYHGLVNAIGHVGLALAAFAWARPPSHSIIHQ